MGLSKSLVNYVLMDITGSGKELRRPFWDLNFFFRVEIVYIFLVFGDRTITLIFNSHLLEISAK